MNIVLWILQILLALLFLFAGVMKFITPMSEMQKQMKIALPGWFVLFIGVVEILGGLGLILPALLKIKASLTPVAAAGLAVVMVGAVVITVAGGDIGPAIFPLIIGLLCVFVAYGRLRLKPIG